MTPVTPGTESAFWTSPAGFTLTYSLAVFSDIDFQVNEGYRRIPHGGIEVGGLLFGRLKPKSASIEAFRMIECAHASGPSFVLSDSDLTRLREQIAASKNDRDLEGLEVLGWFIAHTRTPLSMTDREAALFDELFPGPGKIMLLVKPERFKPTRFGFLVRGVNGAVERDATEQAIILPLSSRAARSEGAPLPSIAAPPEVPGEPPSPEAKSESVETAANTDLVPISGANALPSIDEIRRRRSAYFERGGAPLQLPGEVQPSSVRANLRLTLVLFLAAAVGCGAGYWAYLQLPAATIPLYVQAQPAALVVSWPPEQTHDCIFAALRIDDEHEVPLSLLQRDAGQAKIPASGNDVKIELIAQHWLRDSRGIVRFVKPASPAPPKPVEPTPAAAH